MLVNHEHNDEEVFARMLDEAARGISPEGSNGNTSQSLTSDSQLTDNYEPEEEKDRSRSISTILRYYGQSYKNKIDFQKRYRKVLLIGCGGITVIFAIAVLVVVFYAVWNAGKLDISGIITVITAIISLVVSILDLVRTINVNQGLKTSESSRKCVIPTGVKRSGGILALPDRTKCVQKISA